MSKKIAADVDRQASIEIALERIEDAYKTNSDAVDLSGLGLREIPQQIEKLSALRSLDLSLNEISDIEKDFPILWNLVRLDISKNKFALMPAILSKMKSLEYLDISENVISEIDNELILSSQITFLNIGSNQLRVLPSSISSLSKLNDLDFSNNKISKIPECYGELRKLVRLIVSNNMLVELPSSLESLVNLHVLDLENNFLATLPEFVSKFTELRLLDGSSNKLTNLPVWISKLNNLNSLYLSSNELEELPDEIGNLKELKTFSAARNLLRKLPESFGKLVNLQKIFLWTNQLRFLPTTFGNLEKLDTLILSKNLFSKIPLTIFDLKNLKQLMLFDNKISSVPEKIQCCSLLEALDLYNNKIKKIPNALVRLPNLKRLNLSQNILRDLPALKFLENIEFLDLSFNKISKIPSDVGFLTKLEYLNLSANQLGFLPESMLKLVKLQKILLHGNRRLELPTEILGEVGAFTIFSIVPRSNEAQGILSYYFARKSGTRPLNEMKLVVVGRGAAGKTSLLKNLISGDFDPQEKETPGIEITLWNIPIETDEIIKLNTWDFGGQEILHATHQFFFSERCLYLLVLAGRDGQQQADAEYWLQLIGSFGGDSKVIVALNKSDEHQFDLNRQTLFDKYPGRIAQFCETDCLTGRGVEQLRQIIQDQVVRSEHRRTPFPEVWFEIKESLAKVQSDFYSWDAFVQLCDATGETDPRQQEILAEYLHALGIALNYSRDNRLADTHVLNPRWVTEGVYSLIRNGQKHGTASIDCNMIGDILNKNRYPRSKHDFLLRLMELYQLCFKLPHHDSIYLIPELLSRNQPNISDFVDGCDLSFFYSYSVLPEGLLPRFIVQTHQLSEGYDRWRSGVELRWENCGAIVVADAVEKFVKIFIKGPPSRCREFLAIIRQNFELQHQALKGISILEKIPLRGRPDVLLSYRDLLKREDRKENTFYPENMDEQVSVRELLDGIEPAAIREERRKSKSLQHSAGVPQVIFIDSNVGQIFGDSMQDEGKKVFQQINGGTFNDSAIVGNAEKFDWHAKINCADPGQIKDELNKLNVLIAQVLAQASPHVTEDISRNMTIFAEQASAKSPDKDYLRMAARKLHVGVQSFTAFANPILETLDKIVGLVG